MNARDGCVGYSISCRSVWNSNRSRSMCVGWSFPTGRWLWNSGWCLFAKNKRRVTRVFWHLLHNLLDSFLYDHSKFLNKHTFEQTRCQRQKDGLHCWCYQNCEFHVPLGDTERPKSSSRSRTGESVLLQLEVVQWYHTTTSSTTLHTTTQS